MTHTPRELVLFSVLAFLWAVLSQVQSQMPPHGAVPQLVRRHVMRPAAVHEGRGSARLSSAAAHPDSSKDRQLPSLPSHVAGTNPPPAGSVR